MNMQCVFQLRQQYEWSESYIKKSVIVYLIDRTSQTLLQSLYKNDQQQQQQSALNELFHYSSVH